MPLAILGLALCLFVAEAETKTKSQGLTCSNEDTLELRGAGSSFPSSVYVENGPAYAAQRSWTRDVRFVFERYNSGHGKQRVMKELSGHSPVIFAATESLISKEDKINHPDLVTFPVIAGALVIIHNLPGVTDLNLTVDQVADIFSGKLTQWDDERIQSFNPRAKLPRGKILPVARSDNGGDTEIFTSGLSLFSAEWKQKYGTFINPEFVGGVCCNSSNWPPEAIQYFGNRVTGMVGIVASIPYTVGYAALPNAKGFGVRYASLYNTAGVLTNPDEKAVQSAINYYLNKFPSSLEFGLSGAGADQAYPFVSFSYLIINGSTAPDFDCCTMTEMVGFVDWFLFESKASVIKGYYLSPLSDLAKNRVRDQVLKNITCSGYNLYDEYLISKIPPEPPLFTTTELALLILGIVLLAMVILVSGYVLYQKRVGLAKISLWMVRTEDVHVMNEPTSPGNMKKSIVSMNSTRSKSRTSSTTNVDSSSIMTSMSHLKWYKRATYDGDMFFLLPFSIYRPPKKWSRKLKIAMSNFKLDINHHNLLGITGVCEIGTELYIMSQYAEKGCLHYVLQTTPYTLSPEILFSLSLDVSDGLTYLHKHKIVHGTLNSLTSYIDSSWNLKLADWARMELLKIDEDWKSEAWGPLTPHPEDDEAMIRMVYMDGSVVRDPMNADVAADAFSMGLIILEIFTQEIPYFTELNDGTLSVADILEAKFTTGRNQPPGIPMKIPAGTVSVTIENLTDSDRLSRMTPKAVNLALKKARPSKMGIVDIMMKTMEKYTANLEELVKERTSDLEQATGRLEDLLSEVLPPQIAQKLFRGEAVEPEFFEQATIYFSDIVGFTKISAKSTPLEVMGFLDDLWILFDKVLDRFDVYKVDTIGDAYMVASGLPKRNGNAHVKEVAKMALTLLDECRRFRFRHLPNEKLQIRIGANSGPVTTGVVGSKMPQYCVFGDTVNTASRMESTSETMRIQVSETTQEILDKNYPQFNLQYRGEIPMKGKGDMRTYWLLSERNTELSDGIDTIVLT